MSSTRENDRATLGREHCKLKSGSIGVVGLVALSMGMTSPALGLYSLWGPIQITTGPVAPLVFLAATIIALPTAASYSVLNREAPSAGAASTWLWKAVSPDVGFLVGLVMTTYFFVAIILQPIMFGLFFAELLRFLGAPEMGIPTVIVGALVATILAIVVTYRGAEVSSRSAIILMTVEIGIVIALCVTILVLVGIRHDLNLDPFCPSQATGGIRGFWSATILGILGFCGFDIVSTAAEEAQAPRERIPTAIIWTIVVSSLFWVFTSWILTISVPADDVRKYLSQGITPVTQVATFYWGRGSILVTLTGMTSALAVYIVSVMGSSRMLFAMSRHRLLPDWMCHLHPRYRVPWNAMHVTYLAAIVCIVGSLAYCGNGIVAFTWWANAVVFFALLTFFAVNLANLLSVGTIGRKHGAFVERKLLPVLGMAVNAYVIYEAFFRALWLQDFQTGRSVVIFAVTLLSVLVVIVIATRVSNPARLQGGPPLEVNE